MEKDGLSLCEIEDVSLMQGVIPVRYSRNLPSISVEDQQKLFGAKVVVVGCGGLGGFIIEELARLGVGSILAWDYDCFEEHNLNRQILSQTSTIGHNKVKIAAERVNAINPAVRFNGINLKFEQNIAEEIITGWHIVVDALDNIPSRIALASVCRNLNIPLIHGAVDGWYGQISTQFPAEYTVETLYESAKEISKTRTSTLAFTPAVVASLQCAEVTKVILGRGNLLRKKVMIVNLLEMEMEILEIN